ncbi:hypothetical protein QYE76_029558 [Lolium multiflorum]|uniref:Uncharacterized protein n=1 Tax=Lolium multiflorum TaxID=4521 RepID=A0AAD8VIE5_LOLMU|nr:hypothetical protein QYE76_029558 [Lolium multiflorum]
MLAKDRKSLRQQRAKKDATIARLRAKIVSLEATVKAQEDQLRDLEEEGEDIQGGAAYLSDDDDFEEDEDTDVEGYEFMDAGEDDFIRIDMGPPTRNNNQDAMLQLLQTLMADREAETAERQANISALQQIAHNNQCHGNHDHPGSKLRNFQNTNPPMFSKTEEPLDADDWLQTMENNLEVAGVEAAEKYCCHPLPIRTCQSLVDKRPCNECGTDDDLGGLQAQVQQVPCAPGSHKEDEG